MLIDLLKWTYVLITAAPSLIVLVCLVYGILYMNPWRKR